MGFQITMEAPIILTCTLTKMRELVVAKINRRVFCIQCALYLNFELRHWPLHAPAVQTLQVFGC